MLIRSALRRFVVSGAILFAGGLALHAAEVQVNVKGMDGKNLAGAEVRIEGGGSGAKQSGKTDQKGRYVFKNLGDGHYRVTLLANKPPTSLDNVQYDPLSLCASNLILKQQRLGKSQDYRLGGRNAAVLMAAAGFSWTRAVDYPLISNRHKPQGNHNHKRSDR